MNISIKNPATKMTSPSLLVASETNARLKIAASGEPMNNSFLGLNTLENREWLRDQADTLGYEDIYAWEATDYYGEPGIDIGLVGKGSAASDTYIAVAISKKLDIEVTPYSVVDEEHLKSIFGDVPLLKAA